MQSQTSHYAPYGCCLRDNFRVDFGAGVLLHRGVAPLVHPTVRVGRPNGSPISDSGCKLER